MKFTACYTPVEAGYMGRILEWPEVITEGATLEECRGMLADAAQEMAAVYQEDGQMILMLSDGLAAVQPGTSCCPKRPTAPSSPLPRPLSSMS